jgi:predicted  nucleic acid-binding Zn-ribbon protein
MIYGAFFSFQVRDLVHENSTLRGKVSTLKDQTKNSDVELQTSRDTISRLNAQIDRLNKATSTTTIDMENLRLVSNFINANSSRAN